MFYIQYEPLQHAERESWETSSFYWFLTICWHQMPVVSLSCLPYLLLYLKKSLLSVFQSYIIFPLHSPSKCIFYHAMLCAQNMHNFQIPNRMSNIIDSWIAIKCKILLLPFFWKLQFAFSLVLNILRWFVWFFYIYELRKKNEYITWLRMMIDVS